MACRQSVKAAIAASLVVTFGAAIAQMAPDWGKREFESYCATCHGLSGKGDGPLSRGYLSKAPSNLTELAKKNGGVLPVSRLYASIEGTTAVGPHGTRDMPVWGTRYRVRAAEHYVDVGYDAEAYVRVRVLALIDYVDRLQQR